MMKKRLISSAMLIALFTSVTWAVIPVTDAGLLIEQRISNASLIAKAVSQINQAIAIYQQSKLIYQKAIEAQNYRVLIDGGWKNILTQLPKNEADIFTRGQIDLDEMGWRNRIGKWNKVIETRSAMAALLEVRKVMDAKAPLGNVRENTVKIWGEVPMTADGVRVEAMHQELSTVIAGVAQLQKAIDQTQVNVSNLGLEIDGKFGFRTPVEVERLKAKQSTEEGKLQSLQLQSSNYTNRLLVQLVGNEAAKVTNSELNRLRGNAEMSAWMKGVRFSPRLDNSLRGGVE